MTEYASENPEEDATIWHVKSLKEMADKAADEPGIWEVAKQANQALETAIEKASGVSYETFAHAYRLVCVSGNFGPFERNPDDPTDPMTTEEAAAIVHRTVDRARLSDIDYTDFDSEGGQACPLCGSRSIQTCDDDYAQFLCGSCNKSFEDPMSVPNAHISGSRLLQELFAEYRRIYG